MESPLNQKRIVLGITGSISAYKTPQIIRLLRKGGAEVKALVTEGGLDFVTPLTLQSLSESPIFGPKPTLNQEDNMSHIALAEWADLLVIAPASAGILARLANGFAEDLLSLLVLASKAPRLIVPAMNEVMWEHPATQANVKKLLSHGALFFGPAYGDQACGTVGVGRMEEPEALIDYLEQYFSNKQESQALAGQQVLITAGPTQEAIDPVRYISNKSSGRMGYALARSAKAAGAKVLLISGPTALETPEGIERIDVRTAQEMREAVMSKVANSSIFIACAAVTDYRIEIISEEKLKKSEDKVAWTFIKNPDILATVAALKENRPFTVGFAAETEDIIQNATKKLNSKQLDMIVANQVSEEHGFGHCDNAASILRREAQTINLPVSSKNQLADQIIQQVSEAVTQ